MTSSSACALAGSGGEPVLPGDAGETMTGRAGPVVDDIGGLRIGFWIVLID